jgi:hypothetical protein
MVRLVEFDEGIWGDLNVDQMGWKVSGRMSY